MWPRHRDRIAAWRLAALLLLSICLPGPSAPAGSGPGQSAPDQSRLAAAYGQLPLSFEANQGQADPLVDFAAHGRGYDLSLTAGDAVLSLHQRSTVSVAAVPDSVATVQPPTVLGIHLQGANPQPLAIGEEPLPGVANYFIGNDPSQWHTGIPTYARVRYQDVYPGIDLLYYGTSQGQLEDDFVVAPGADPSRIQLKFDGATALELEATGTLLVRMAGAQIQVQQPIVYQEAEGVRVPVAAAYALDGEQVGFELGAYDRTRPLIVDPVLDYLTYLGGSAPFGDEGHGIAVDTTGNVYVTGWTSSRDFPITPGAFQPRLRSRFVSAFVSKLNATGTALLYSTYLGGHGSEDYATGLTIDPSGNVYLTGFAASTDFPTTPGAFQRTLAGVENAFVTKLDATGSMLVYSTYLGGSGLDGGNAIAVDASGNALITGATESDDFPTTPGAFQRTFRSSRLPTGSAYTSESAFMSKLNPTGSALAYSTFLGGKDGSTGSGIAVDGASRASVTGSAGTDFPTTPGSLQPVASGGPFVARVDPAGTALEYSTYLTGGRDDAATGIALDAAGNTYVTGWTSSPEFPTTPGAFEPTYPSSGLPGFHEDAFVSKLTPTGSALVYSTYLGGGSAEGVVDAAAAIVVDAAGNAYITGRAQSQNFPTTPGTLQPRVRGEQDTFVTKLNPAGTGVVYSTLLGGSQDFGTAIAVGGAGHVYITGITLAADLPSTPGVIQRTPKVVRGLLTAFVSQIGPGPPACAIQALLPGPPAQLKVLVHADQGLTGLVVSAATNTSVALPSFYAGSTDTFLVTATKLDQSARATLTLRATDQTGAATDCDPALVTVGRAPGDSPVQVIHHVARAESHVAITNGRPGIENLRLLVNGHPFEVTELHAGEQRTLDVSSAMRKGSDNTILAIAHGLRGGSAVVLVSDT